MSALKWLQLVCWFILVLLPAAMHYRNWKHADKRTKLHRWITRTLIALWILCALGISLTMYKEFSRTERGPILTVYVNDALIGEHGTVNLPLTDSPTPLRWSIRNVGNVGADGVRMVVNYPGTNQSQVKMLQTGGWTESQLLDVTEDSISKTPDQSFAIDDNRLIAVGDFLDFSTLLIWSTNMTDIRSRTWISASTRNGPSVRKSITLHLKRGITGTTVTD